MKNNLPSFAVLKVQIIEMRFMHMLGQQTTISS